MIKTTIIPDFFTILMRGNIIHKNELTHPIILVVFYQIFSNSFQFLKISQFHLMNTLQRYFHYFAYPDEKGPKLDKQFFIV